MPAASPSMSSGRCSTSSTTRLKASVPTREVSSATDWLMLAALSRTRAMMLFSDSLTKSRTSLERRRLRRAHCWRDGAAVSPGRPSALRWPRFLRRRWISPHASSSRHPVVAFEKMLWLNNVDGDRKFLPRGTAQVQRGRGSMAAMQRCDTVKRNMRAGVNAFTGNSNIAGGACRAKWGIKWFTSLTERPMNVFIGKLDSNAAAPEPSIADRRAANADRRTAMAHDMSQADRYRAFPRCKRNAGGWKRRSTRRPGS